MRNTRTHSAFRSTAGPTTRNWTGSSGRRRSPTTQATSQRSRIRPIDSRTRRPIAYRSVTGIGPAPESNGASKPAQSSGEFSSKCSARESNRFSQRALLHSQKENGHEDQHVNGGSNHAPHNG